MALDFPTSPSNGQTYTNGTLTWVYDSTQGKWKAVRSAAVIVSATAPTGTEGAFWYDTTDGTLMVYYDSFWVEASGTSTTPYTTTIESGTFTTASALTISSIPATYRYLSLVLTDLTVSDTSGVQLRVTVLEGGSEQTGSVYDLTYLGRDSGDVAISNGVEGGTYMQLSPSGSTAGSAGIGADSNESAHAELRFFAYASATLNTQMLWSMTFVDATGTASVCYIEGAGRVETAATTDGIKIVPNTGTISGSYILYGIT